jgi:hypothetical protein
MSRSGYSDDNDGALQLWRANVDRTIAAAWLMTFAFGFIVERLTKRPVIIERQVIPISIGGDRFNLPDGQEFIMEVYGGGAEGVKKVPK